MFIKWKKNIEGRLQRLESDFLCMKGLHTWATDGSTFHPKMQCVFCKKYYESEPKKTDT